MKKVKIIQGVYGASENNRIIPKTKNDTPFLLEEEKAERIVSLGIAEYVEEIILSSYVLLILKRYIRVAFFLCS